MRLRNSLHTGACYVRRILNLNYRRFAVGKRWELCWRLTFPVIAEGNSAIQQIENLRYVTSGGPAGYR